jgi:hypothetical protein
VVSAAVRRKFRFSLKFEFKAASLRNFEGFMNMTVEGVRARQDQWLNRRKVSTVLWMG